MQDHEAGPRARYGESLSAGVLESPAAERNKGPILAVLERVLPAEGLVLEIASGTGQHVTHFARALPKLTWQPSDPDTELEAAMHARVRAASLPNLRAPLALDVRDRPWPIEQADAIVCINMIHIAPWSAAEALFAGAERLLRPGAALVLYGPFKRSGRHTAPSNASFDVSLRERNPEWGVRDLDDVAALARRRGFALADVTEMPANNLTVVLRREPG